jgi:catechol 2,3-dioxygenase-like lactoylglutathione lyase family enzyme
MTLGIPRMSEIVIKTARFAALREWYERALAVTPFFIKTDAQGPSWTGAWSIAFYRLHVDYPYTQVLGLFEVPGVEGRAIQTAGNPGMHHMQFRNATLDELFERYDLMKAAGVLPLRTYNHGPGTSFYYEDPDGNTVELSSSNFDNEADYLHYFTTDAYKRNISGIAIDAEDYIRRYRSGTPRAELIRISG